MFVCVSFSLGVLFWEFSFVVLGVGAVCCLGGCTVRLGGVFVYSRSRETRRFEGNFGLDRGRRAAYREKRREGARGGDVIPFSRMMRIS